jgi:hypothetical protein
MSNAKYKQGPVLIPGKGWDVKLNDGAFLCDGRGPYTLAQAQVAYDNYRRDEARAAIAKAKAKGK